MKRRLIAVGAFAGLMMLLAPGAAAANVTGGCDGWVQFPGDPVRYDPSYDTRSRAIPIPDGEGIIVDYHGETPWGNEDHSGKISIVIAGLNIKVADWSGDDEDATEKTDKYALDNARDEISRFVPVDLLTGIYRVRGEHSAKAGSCTGFVYVKFGGSPLNSVAGWIVIGGLIVTGSGLVIAFRTRPMPIMRRTP